MSTTRISIQMKCEDCGHEQTVKGFMIEDGSVYFGSSYDWCDNCDTGLPVRLEGDEMKILNTDQET